MVRPGCVFDLMGSHMPDYADILTFLASHPPEIPAERQLHASLLELLAECLRGDPQAIGVPVPGHRAGGPASAVN